MDRLQVISALEKFLLNKAYGVLALSGSWGVGKTHLLRAFLDTVKNKSGFNGHSYASLFGVTDVAGMRAKATENMILHRDRKEILERYGADARASLVPFNLIFPASQTLVRFLNTGWTGVASQAAYWFLRDSIVCLDDIERADVALTPKMIMGFVDELRAKGCKVVIVLNREKVSEVAEYAKFWEKVVDADIRLSPSVSENVALAFGVDGISQSAIAWARHVFEAVNAANLRVHKRAAWLIQELERPLSGTRADVQQLVIIHAVLLTWAVLDPDAVIPLKVLQSTKFGFLYRSIASDMAEQSELTSQEKLWEKATQKLNFSPADFDRLLIEMIQTGWCDSAELSTALALIEEEVKRQDARLKLRQAFRQYGESFMLDQRGFAQLLRGALRDTMDYLNVFEFDEGVVLLQQNGDQAEDLVSEFLVRRRDHLQRVAEAANRNQEIKDARLAAEVAQREQEYQKRCYSIDEVAHHFATNDSWNNKQVEFLASRTPEEFKQWILTEPSNLRLKIRAVLDLGRYGGSNYAAAAAPLEQALRLLSAESEFNRKRIANIYGVEAGSGG